MVNAKEQKMFNGAISGPYTVTFYKNCVIVKVRQYPDAGQGIEAGEAYKKTPGCSYGMVDGKGISCF